MNVNAGVHANIGMDFQKNCTIYLLFEKYSSIKSKKYFIALEHHEDVVFGFLTKDDKLLSVESHQAKKSTKKWSIGGLYEIIQKIAESSQLIIDDPVPKAPSFTQKNYFTSNNTIELKCRKGKNSITHTINETTEVLSYKDLDKKTKDSICKGNSTIAMSSQNIKNFDSLNFRYIDIGRNSKSQFNQLKGMVSEVFGEKISDPDAALKSLYFALKEVEHKFNQGNKAFLNDKSKRLNGDRVAEVLNILTKKSLAFDFWRRENPRIRETLNISMFESQSFKLHYMNSFDKFKDLTDKEHQKILKNVNSNIDVLENHTDDFGCIQELYDRFKKEKSTSLLDLQLKAIISAAYVELKMSL